MDTYQKLIMHPDDWQFVYSLVHHAPDHILPALFCAYLASWRHAAMMEPLPHKKDNAGRRAANTRLRTDADRMQQGDQATMELYGRLVREGPKRGCATCRHCTLLGECGNDLPMNTPWCSEWERD